MCLIYKDALSEFIGSPSMTTSLKDASFNGLDTRQFSSNYEVFNNFHQIFI